MKVRIQMVFESEDGKPQVIEEVGQLQRGPLRPSEMGLSLAEAKSLLHGMQQSMVAEQVDQYLSQFKTCAHCNAQRTKKGQHTIVFRTLFGKLNISSPRLYDPKSGSYPAIASCSERFHGGKGRVIFDTT